MATRGVPRLPVARRPMTEAEQDMAAALTPVRFVPASFDKRMGQLLAARVYASLEEGGRVATISEGEAGQLRRLVQRYRRQLPAAVVALAGPKPEPRAWERSA